jgi:hypothetical protein
VGEVHFGGILRDDQARILGAAPLHGGMVRGKHSLGSGLVGIEKPKGTGDLSQTAAGGTDACSGSIGKRGDDLEQATVEPAILEIGSIEFICDTFGQWVWQHSLRDEPAENFKFGPDLFSKKPKYFQKMDCVSGRATMCRKIRP